MGTTHSRKNNIIICSLWSIYFILIPVYMISLSPKDYTFMNGSLLLLTSIILTVIFSVVSILILRFSIYFKGRKYLEILLYFGLTWLCIAGFLIPVTQNAGMVDAINIDSNKFNFILVFAITSVLTFLLFTKVQKFVLIFVAILTGMAVIQGIPSASTILISRDTNGLTTLSKEKNILVISFDGIPQIHARQAMDEYPELREAFKDFTLFNNVISASPSTIASITSELYGPIDLASIGNTQEELFSKLDKSELLLNNANFDSYTYGEYSLFNLNSDTSIPIGGIVKSVNTESQIADVVDFYDYVTVRIGTRHLLKLLNRIHFDRINLKVIIGTLIGADTQKSDLERNVSNHTGLKWDKKYILTINDYDSFLNKLSAEKKPPCMRHMHFTFTHHPVDFDKEAHYQSHNEKWHTENQNRNGAYNETVGALFKFAKLLENLKQLGIYKNSFIVLKSDHGKPAKYYSSRPHTYKLNNHAKWSIGRYLPLLMIKTENAEQKELSFAEEMVSLDDLSYTLKNRYAPEMITKDLPGIDLLDLKNPNRTDKETSLFLYAPIDESATYRFKDLFSVQINRKKNLYESIKDIEGISLD